MHNKLLIIILLLSATYSFGQHVIKGDFSPAQDYEYAILYKVTPTTSLYKANSKINSDGSFEIALDSTMTKGIYRIVYAVPQEEFNFDLIYNGKEDIELAFNAETGVTFLNSTENKLYSAYTESMSTVSKELGELFKNDSTNKKQLKKIFKIQRETQEEFEKAAENTLAFSFIKASAPYIPEKFESLDAYFKGFKDTYFQHLDFKDPFLQSSNFLVERLLNYVFGMASVGDNLESVYSANIDDVAKVIETVDPALRKTFLEIIWQQMADASYETAANYTSETYVMSLATILEDQDLLDAMLLYKNTSINSTAPDFSFEILEEEKPVTQSLLGLENAQRYVIFFWSSVCSHCLDEIPQLRDFEKTFEGNVKVIAIGLEEEPYRWKDMTYDYPNFIHVYGEGKWDNTIGNNYNVRATPTYYVLDADKKIIDKPEDIEALKIYFKEHPLEKKEDNKKAEVKEGN
jgi:thiol-disulfide isomerase/thioredoxin